mgnify:CR=1 FL=1
MSAIRLGVNVDHVATLRQQRDTRYPDPVHAAAIAERAGADQITVHLREDRRHIQDRDLRVMRETVQVPLNLEMAVTDEMVQIALAYKPATVTLVPEKREERTTEGGLDVVGLIDKVTAAVRQLIDAGIVVSLFIDPDPDQVAASHATGATTIELHTGDYCDAPTPAIAERELERLRVAAVAGHELGLTVAAGHGIDYRNVGPIAALPHVEELNIGHSIVCHAVFVGLERAVSDMVAAMAEGKA